MGLAEELGLLGDDSLTTRATEELFAPTADLEESVRGYYESLGPQLERSTAEALEKVGMGAGGRHSTAGARAIGETQEDFYSNFLNALVEAGIEEGRLGEQRRGTIVGGTQTIGDILESIGAAEYGEFKRQADYPLAIGQLLTQLSAAKKPKRVITGADTGAEDEGVLGACVIFTAAHGKPHPLTRLYRDQNVTTRTQRGYYWFADRVVPRMKKFRFIKEIMKFVMVSPLTAYAKYYYRFNRIGVVFSSLTAAWLLFFDLLGRRPPYRRRGTQEVV